MRWASRSCRCRRPVWCSRCVSRGPLESVCRYAFGECYYEVTKDQAEELLDKKKDEAAEEIAKLEEEMSNTKSTLSDLKAKLYGRFGKSINLEE